jgi:hypothetical protein
LEFIEFARGSRTDAQIGMLATVLARYDVIPLQEIRTDDLAVKFLATVLKDELGIDFDSFTSDPVSCERRRSVKRREKKHKPISHHAI